MRNVVEMAPRLSSAEIDNDKAITALRARVCDIGYASAGRSNVRPEVKTHVVEILVTVQLVKRSSTERTG